MNKPTDSAAALRSKAETRYRQSPGYHLKPTKQQAKELLQELSVHQIELEMQNEALHSIQHTLEQSCQQYAELYDEAPVGYITSSCNGKISMVNHTMATMLGTTKPALKTRGLDAFLDQPDVFYLHARQALDSKASIAAEMLLIRHDGTELWARIESKSMPEQSQSEQPRLIKSVVIDITEKKRLDQRLRQTQQLESIGLLAAGIAHDFNNILATVLANVELAMHYIEPESKALSNMKNSVQALLRAKELTAQLLTFSKGGDPVKQATSLSQLLRDTVAFVLHGSAVVCEFDMADDLWPGDIDPTQMSQVMQNIVINACQAMPDGGVIRVKCQNITDGSVENSALCAKGYIKILIRDSGHGIEENDLIKIFIPFFSTKKSGNGLGLSIAHSIINKHLGHISVDSQVGIGTTFTIYLPVAAHQVEHPDVVHKPVPKVLRSARILVMDDEPTLQSIIQSVLQLEGHEVVLADDGMKAIELVIEQEKRTQPFDIIILDLTIPGGMGGGEAIKEILRINPDARVIATSGYANAPVLANYRQYGFKGSLTKPFQLSELKEVINKLLT